MKDRDQIKELFSEKLGNYEAKVNPRLWNNIASQIGATTVTTAASTGISLLTKWIIGASIASVVAVTAIIVVNNSDETVTKENPKTEKVAESNPSSEEITQQPDKKNAEEKGVVVLDSEPKRIIKRQNWDDLLVNRVTPEDRSDKAQPELPIKDKMTQPAKPAETEIKLKVEQKFEPITEEITKEDEPLTETIVIENQTPDAAESSYKIGELPNVFSPNRDGVNDFFFIESKGLSEFTIVVLDINSKVVFQSNDPEFKWDGNDLSGSPVPDGPNRRYIYYLTARDKNGSPVNKGNYLTINR